jgi:hypothetical protein
MEFLKVGEETGEINALTRLDSHTSGSAPDDRPEAVLLQTSAVS